MLSAKDYLEMLKNYEEALADLYDAIGAKSFFRKSVWKTLSSEGDARIEKINELIDFVDKNKNALILRNFVGTDAVEAKNFVLNVLNLFDAGKISKRECIKRIADIESSVMEMDLYGKLSSENIAIREIIDKLRYSISRRITTLNTEKKRWF